ncbi:hypothetical protein TVAG_191470 [Trichomonas vaginalis G3]|uniref:Uncharacterized protein n=1 Tax=Trichomonas vaginalis (strain ATCC PRA-98 / G3) TaxID=412133 RepID=A2EQK3_TRIV3|nr:hypothetical protein TVAGG3_0976460 [Trichomonas vaginalis G3]EAY05050.1 hypothetical protein TVAG_191470 [Trichomonas vaginalis G3]KAI5488968.1 hypothetical protein TVAGG3_0976460 [Trichomonas vaginalis G3]|eukprot:XP_001317273.1 hypothetical protein [Trichomonas vaginalis G3]
MEEDNSVDLDLDLSNKNISLHNIGLSDSYEFNEEEPDNENSKINHTNDQLTKIEDISIQKYDQLLHELTNNSKNEEDSTKIYPKEDDLMEICLTISKIASSTIKTTEIPSDKLDQKNFIVNIVQQLVNLVQNPTQSPQYLELLAKNKNKKIQLAKLQQKYDFLYEEVNRYKNEVRKISESVDSKKETQIDQKIQQIADLVELQKKTQKKLLRETKHLHYTESIQPEVYEPKTKSIQIQNQISESESSSEAINISRPVDKSTKHTKSFKSSHEKQRTEAEFDELMEKRSKYHTNNTSKTDIKRTKRIPYPESSSTESSSDLIILTTKPQKITNISKVHHRSYKYENNSDSLSQTDENFEKSDQYSKLGKKVNKLIGITNHIQGDFETTHGNLSLSQLSMLHESLLDEERKLRK